MPDAEMCKMPSGNVAWTSFAEAQLFTSEGQWGQEIELQLEPDGTEQETPNQRDLELTL